MAETYNKMCKQLVPQYDFLQNEVLRLISMNLNSNMTVIDLGAGSGIFLEKILATFPNAKCYWVDSSNDFMRAAESRLSKFGDRIKFVLSSLENNWENDIDINPDFIVSMSAIHHLESKDKKQLYKRCYNILNKTGWLFNIDEMKTAYEDAYMRSLYFWVDYVNKSKEQVALEDMPYYEK